jgi:hypothetical protein
MSEAKLRWFSSPEPRPKGWSNQELAEFYRIMDIMDKAGLAVEVDQGLSDEGDPWFVFVRRASSDVIAHFARIDNKFVSVSSLNQELYSGKDVRSVVDQMLQSHPLMLPMQRGDGRLFLHPGVVLTAFVAAAFLTAIDGSGATDIKHLIESTFSNANSENVNELGWVKSDFIRGDIAVSNPRNAGWEANQTSPNMVLLGAALMAQENWIEVIKAENKIGSGDVRSKAFAETISEIFYMSGNDDSNGLEQVLKNTELNLENKVDLSALNFDQKQIVSLEGTSSEENIESFRWFWDPQDVGGIQIASLNETSEAEQGSFEAVPILLDSAWQQLESRMLAKYSEFNNNLNVEDQEYSGFSNNKEMTGLSFGTQGRISSFSLEEVQLPVKGPGIGVTVSDDGEFSFVAMKMDTLSDKFNDTDYNIFFDSSETSVSFDENRDGLLAISPEQEIASDTLEPSDYDQGGQLNSPILGHRLSGYGTDHIKLSDAIDVLFYDGGDMKVEGFELGKDLLWFFLPEEIVAQADRQILEGGELYLEFEGIGNLTFVGILQQDDNSFLL